MEPKDVLIPLLPSTLLYLFPRTWFLLKSSEFISCQAYGLMKTVSDLCILESVSASTIPRNVATQELISWSVTVVDIPKSRALTQNLKSRNHRDADLRLLFMNNMLLLQLYFFSQPGVSLTIPIYKLTEVIKSTCLLQHLGERHVEALRRTASLFVGAALPLPHAPVSAVWCGPDKSWVM